MTFYRKDYVMKINKYLLFGGVAAVFISIIGNYQVFVSNQLEKPIMLKHYYYLPSNHSMLNLYYIDNRSDNLEIQSISIPEIDDMFHSPFYGEPSHGQTIGHYKLKTFYLKLDENFMDENWSFNKIIAHLVNGESIELDVGEVTLFQQKDRAFSFQSSGSSSDHTGYHIFKALQPVEITSLNIPYAEELTNTLSLKLNSNGVELQGFLNQPVPEILQDTGEPPSAGLLPLKIRTEELLSVRYQFTFPKNDENRLNFYDFDVSLQGIGDGGQKFTDTFNLNYQPYLDKKDLKAIVQEGRND